MIRSPVGEPTAPEAPVPDDLGPLPEPEPLKGLEHKSPPLLISAAAASLLRLSACYGLKGSETLAPRTVASIP
jgi:hypothetical protein